jgi:hypothetical protein
MMGILVVAQNDKNMDDERRAFYEYSSALLEPWDGPALLTFTDGDGIGATLDRNGLRPGRYYITHDNLVVMASEVGVVDLPPASIKEKGRLRPGNIFYVDLKNGVVKADAQMKAEIAAMHPYREWLDQQQIKLPEVVAAAGDVAVPAVPCEASGREGLLRLLTPLRTFGYTVESIELLLGPSVAMVMDPLGSMGNDAPLAFLSQRPKLLYDYFKQIFAQVTNPPIDPIREAVVTSLECMIGPEGDLTTTTKEQAHRLCLKSPLLDTHEMESLKVNSHRGWKTLTIDITYPRASGLAGLKLGLERIQEQAEKAVDEGYQLIVLSDRNISPEQVPISALLATGAAHAHLTKCSKVRVVPTDPSKLKTIDHQVTNQVPEHAPYTLGKSSKGFSHHDLVLRRCSGLSSISLLTMVPHPSPLILHSAPSWVSWWTPARRARCTTSALWWGSARTASAPTWPSRPSWLSTARAASAPRRSSPGRSLSRGTSSLRRTACSRWVFSYIFYSCLYWFLSCCCLYWLFFLLLFVLAFFLAFICTSFLLFLLSSTAAEKSYTSTPGGAL